MTHASILDLFEHMHWADAAIWRAVTGSSAASKDTVTQARLHHIHLTQQAFFHVWRQQPFDYQSISFPDLTGLMRYAHEFHAAAVPYLAALDDAAWLRPTAFPWAHYFAKHFGREAAVPTFQETALQLALHTTHHRGQVSARLRELDTEPPLTDYIIWLWLDRPAPIWSE
jgi:uncharacterized damage-inducible protein DinB